MAKKRRKKTATRGKKASRGKTRKKTRTRTTRKVRSGSAKKRSRKARRKTSALQTAVDTVEETGRLRDKMLPPGESLTE